MADLERPKVRIVYSCVVDRNPRFLRQAVNLVLSLRAVGVAPCDILVNLTPAAEVFRESIARFGCTPCSTIYFADGKYCNKVAQLRNAPDDADFFICCDTDLLFLRNIRLDLVGKEGLVLGKVVDFDNPPIDRLKAVAALFPDLPSIPETNADVNGKPTLCGNFNGGLYILPGRYVRQFSAAWEAEALRLYESAEAQAILSEFGWHTDQISFCFALAKLGLRYETLPIEFNFPLHFPVDRDSIRDAAGVRVLHYHNAVDENFLPSAEKVTRPELKVAVAQANDAIRQLHVLHFARQERMRRAAHRFTFIMGFHRSGTSLLASGCESVGFSVGSGPLLAASFDNPKGFYENRRLVKLNEEIQRGLDSEWDDIFFSFGDRCDEISRAFLLRISKFLECEFLTHPHPNSILKDPRMMQTYTIWRTALRAMGQGDPDLLFVYRNPLECAESQRARHKKSYQGNRDPFHFFGQDLRETLLLWYTYNMRFLMALDRERFYALRYEDLIAAPGACMQRIAEWANLQADKETLARFTTEFFEMEMRHHEHSLEDLRKVTLNIPFVYDLALRLDDLGRRGIAHPHDIRRIVSAHGEHYASLMQYDFLGRLFAVPRLKWLASANRR